MNYSSLYLCVLECKCVPGQKGFTASRLQIYSKGFTYFRELYCNTVRKIMYRFCSYYTKNKVIPACCVYMRVCAWEPVEGCAWAPVRRVSDMIYDSDI